MFERIATGLVCGMSLLACASGVARAQAGFPNRPITMVVPLPAGGTADLLCRFAAEKASGLLGQQMVIENRAGGAGGRVGTESVLRSPPDGYTILCAPQLTYSITHLVFTKAAFDTRAMEPISVLATYPLIVLARMGLPANNMSEFLAYAQANPGKVNYGHQGKGNTGHHNNACTFFSKLCGYCLPYSCSTSSYENGFSFKRQIRVNLASHISRD